MAHLLAPREITYETVNHPETLAGWCRHGEEIVRIDHPSAAAIREELHDPRLALYAHTTRNEWQLWRLEFDGKYRLTHAWPGQVHLLGPEFVKTVLEWFLAHDTRRGYDVVADVAAHEATRERRLDSDFSDFTQDWADHYLWPALRKAGLHRHASTSSFGWGR